MGCACQHHECCLSTFGPRRETYQTFVRNDVQWSRNVMTSFKSNSRILSLLRMLQHSRLSTVRGSCRKKALIVIFLLDIPYLNRINIDHMKSNSRYGGWRHMELYKPDNLVVALKLSPNVQKTASRLNWLDRLIDYSLAFSFYSELESFV